MELEDRLPKLKGKPFFEQLKLSIKFIDSNIKHIENSVKTTNTEDEHEYVNKILTKVEKINEDVNYLASVCKTNSLDKKNDSFEDELQNLKDALRFKEIEYNLEPFQYSRKKLLDNKEKNFKNINRKDTFVFKEKEKSIKKFIPAPIKLESKENINDLTTDSLDNTNQFSFDFKLPLNKFRNNFSNNPSFTNNPSFSNFSVDESLEIEFTPGLKSRRNGKKKSLKNNLQDTSTIDLFKSPKNLLINDEKINYTKLSTPKEIKKKPSPEKIPEDKPTKLLTPKKPEIFDLFN